jgi:serine phosphatase RsbU (regulator of sigma subunit)
MRQIGGDLLFTFRHGASAHAALSAVLLDVTGHGITSALTVSRLVGELQRIFAENPDARPGQVLESLNRYVCLTLARHNLYASAICWRIDIERDRLEYANGGHPSAFLRRSDGTIEMLASTAFLLGLEAVDAFQPAPIELRFAPGDALVAYTDGAAEAKNSHDAMLGMEGVRRILEGIAHSNHAPPDWPGQMLRHVLDYRGAPPDDDTLVAAVFRPIA